MNKLFVGVGVLVVLLAGLFVYNNPTPPLSGNPGPDYFNQQNFWAGLRIGNQNNSVTTNRQCSSASWNPPSLTSSTVGTTSVTGIKGIAFGDIVTVSLATNTVSSTPGILVNLWGAVSAASASTGTITVSANLPGTNGGWDIATTTVNVCASRN